MGFTISGNRIIGAGEHLRVAFDANDGRLVELTNLRTGQQLVAPDSELPPWRMYEQGTVSSWRPTFVPASGFEFEEITPARFTYETGYRARLVWETSDDGVTVEVVAGFDVDGALELWPTVRVEAGTRPPSSLTYPLLEPARLSDRPETERLLFPHHAGWLISDPMAQTNEGVYPDGFHGLSVQLMAYFTQGEGGFSVAAHDPHVTHKQLMFGPGGAWIRHDTWDLRRGATMDLDYPVVITALRRGDWYEAADVYRKWALTAPWSRKGANAARSGDDRPAWLFEKTGLSVWCAPSSLDWSDRYRWLAETAGTPLHVVAGWDWPATRPHYVGKEGWFPARFHEANLEAWKGHYVTPYLNDLFVSYQADGFHEEWEPNLIFPYKSFTFQVFADRNPGYLDGTEGGGDTRVITDVDFFLCPATEKQREFHAWRDRKLVSDYGLDGIFYDISSGNPHAARCIRVEHGHAPGWSREVLAAYAENNAVSRRAVRDAIGRVPAQGTETIVEHIIADIDFYVSRSVAGPLGGLEAYTPAPETPPGGGRELVPLFQAIYHDVGPVHEDGWLTLAQSFGTAAYWIAARITLTWGGIISMHYANCPAEAIEGHDTSEVISWDGDLHRFTDLEPPDPVHQAVLTEMAAVRTGIGNRYLAYGRLLPPLDLDVPDTDIGFFRRNPVLTGIVRRGTWSVPRVVQGVWESPEGSVGIFLFNIGDDDMDLAATAAPVGWSVPAGTTPVVRGGSGKAGMGADGTVELALRLPSRRVVLVEMVPDA